MMTSHLWLILALAASGSVGHDANTAGSSFGPSVTAAAERGPEVFNAIYNAMRQFGSAYHHNGMSVFPATIPEGTLLYHGTHTQEMPAMPEWLSFEIEHAENFAVIVMPPPANDQTRDWRDLLNNRAQHPLLAEDDDRGNLPPGDMPELRAGYLHVYQASRPLKVLYIDGTSAGKTRMGTLDTQDRLLTNGSGGKSDGFWFEHARAEKLCRLGREMGLDGFIRMEIGFEVIKCDFHEGLNLLSTCKRPERDEAESYQPIGYHWVRAAAQRYHGIAAARVILDFSSMVSAYFYPLNLTNPDAKRLDLPRLAQATADELMEMREHVKNATLRSRSSSQDQTVDWQGVTDLIVSRYADALALMNMTNSFHVMRGEVNDLLTIYIDYSAEEGIERLDAARKRCAEHYLQSVNPQTPEDQLIKAAIESTATAICTALFRARHLVVERDEDTGAEAVQAVHQIIGNLTATLQWSRWKECGRCQVDEICLIAMWPFGAVEDHYNPSCRAYDGFLTRHGYWDLPGPGGPRPGKPPPDESDPNNSSVGEL